MNQKQIFKKYNLLFIVIFFILLSLILEYIYITKNSPQTFGLYYLWREQKTGYVKNPEVIAAINRNEYSYSRIFYELALKAYKDGQKAEFVKYLKIATKIDPTISYWSVELANYYYSVGEKDKAYKILQECQKLDTPRKHCEEIENYFKDEKPPFDVGFLNKNVEEIYSQAK